MAFSPCSLRQPFMAVAKCNKKFGTDWLMLQAVSGWIHVSANWGRLPTLVSQCKGLEWGKEGAQNGTGRWRNGASTEVVLAVAAHANILTPFTSLIPWPRYMQFCTSCRRVKSCRELSQIGLSVLWTPQQFWQIGKSIHCTFCSKGLFMVTGCVASI